MLLHRMRVHEHWRPHTSHWGGVGVNELSAVAQDKGPGGLGATY